jgi:tetratricopeptide (TPR) repeat protein
MSKRGWPHVDDPVAVGRRLKDARLAAGMSQRELSFPGCTAVYVCRIERGDRVPSLQVLRELARRLEVDEDFLATGIEGGRVDGLLEADVALRLDQLELAEHLYTQALENGTDRTVRGRALGGLAEIDLHAGRVDEAVGGLEEARSLLGDGVVRHPGIVDALARAYSMRGEYESAIGVLEHALELARAGTDEVTEVRLSILLANVLIDSENLASARELLGKSIAKATILTDPILQARLYWSQSRLHSAESNGDAASHYARMALASIELTENVAHAARAHHLLAHVELERGNADEALELLEQGHALALRAGGAETEGCFKVDKARALAALGRDDEAVELALAAGGELTEDRPEQAGRAYAVAADVFARRGDGARALELYELAAELVTDRHPDFVREVCSKMAELLEAEGRKEEALELLKRAVGLQSQVPDNA